MLPNRRASLRRRAVGISVLYVLVSITLTVIAVRQVPKMGLFRQGYSPASVPVNWTIDADHVHAAVDIIADPCTDFHAYACGGWLDQAIIPADRSSLSRSFTMLGASLDQLVKAIFEDNWPGLSPAYRACLAGENSTDEQSRAFLEPHLQLLESSRLESPEDLAIVLGTLHRFGIPAFFQFGSSSDPDAPIERPNVGAFDVGGLGLPTTFYGNLSTNDPLQHAYRAHLASLLALVGEDGAEDVYNLEEFLAATALTPEQRRDPSRLTTKKHLRELLSLSIAWPQYFTALWEGRVAQSGFLHHDDELLIVEQEYMQTIISTLHLFPPETLKRYLQTRIVSHFSPHLSARYRNESYHWSSQMSGSTAHLPHDQFCRLALKATPLGWALSHVYTTSHFTTEHRADVQAMIEEIVVAFDTHLPKWMGEEAQRAARTKLDTLRRKIGFPDSWPNIDAVIDAVQSGNTHMQNWQAIQAAQVRMDLHTIGQRPDPQRWEMHPLDVNAYYSPEQNEIVFPAAILSGQFYAHDRPAARNYGAIGAVFGHELTHGFDDEGRQFDQHGRLRPWWPEHIVDEFKHRASCIEALYEKKAYCAKCPSRYCEQPANRSATRHCHHGDLTLGENLADIGGVMSAFRAWMQTRDADPEMAAQEDEFIPQYYNGLRPDQLFFVSYAQNWCEVYRAEAIEMQLENDPHSLGFARVYGPLSQFSEFHKSFGCEKPKSKSCDIW